MSHPEADALTAQIVEDYLRDHPDFFVERPELVDRLSLPHQQMGSVSLVHIQLARQRQRIEELEEEITTLMSLAASNDKTFHEFMELQDKVLHCDSLVDVFAAVRQMARQLGLTVFIRLLEPVDSRYAISREHWQRFAINHFNGKDTYLGRLRKADRQLLFGDDDRAPELGSYVILPLAKQNPLGILAFASDDGGHYQPCMDTLFLRHLALVLSHVIDTLPWHNSDEERISQPSA